MASFLEGGPNTPLKTVQKRQRQRPKQAQQLPSGFAGKLKYRAARNGVRR
jgi:hypothetical protein